MLCIERGNDCARRRMDKRLQRLKKHRIRMETSTKNSVSRQRGKRLQIGAFPRCGNEFGALDMVGNVWEWVDGKKAIIRFLREDRSRTGKAPTATSFSGKRGHQIGRGGVPVLQITSIVAVMLGWLVCAGHAAGAEAQVDWLLEDALREENIRLWKPTSSLQRNSRARLTITNPKLPLCASRSGKSPRHEFTRRQTGF